jgi:5'-nucleotidase
MRLLIANDDGIHSPGIAVLARVARAFGEVIVVAPDVERSSASHAISATRPLSYRRTRLAKGIEAYRVDGTPADCVALGLFHQSDIDVVLSGVNLGTNLGNGMWHSGTLAAAQQAVLLGTRGIALSTPVIADDTQLDQLAPYIERVLELLLPHDELRLVNVNLPARPRGLRWTRQAVEKYDGRVVPAQDPYERPVFWLAVTQLREHAPDTDLWAFERGYVTMTPLRLDLTDHSALAAISAGERVVEFEEQRDPAVISDEDAAGDDGQLPSPAWTTATTTETSSTR